MRKRKKSGPAFVQIYHYMIKCDAWKDLSPGARALYLELKSLYNGKNNGSLGLGVRWAGEALGMSRASGDRFIDELEIHGFIRKTRNSSFHQKKLATEWALTELRNDLTNELPSKDFMRWGKASTKVKKQKPVSKTSTTVPSPRLSSHPQVPDIDDSIAGETITEDFDTAQSHWRDPSTSEPSGGPQKVPLLAAPSPLVVRAIRAELESSSCPSEQDGSITPLAESLAKQMSAKFQRDPLVQAVLEIFPGSSMHCSISEVANYVHGHASAHGAHRQGR